MIQASAATPAATPAGTAAPYLACRLSLAQTTKPAATVASTTMVSESMDLLGKLRWPGDGQRVKRAGLELAETYAPDLLGTDFHVSQCVARNNDQASFVILQAQFAALINGFANNLGHRLR